MPEPTRFDIKRRGTVWTLTRDDKPDGEYSHLDRATHDAAGRARELQETGVPTRVFVHANDKVIEIDLDPATENPDLADNGAAFTRTAPL